MSFPVERLRYEKAASVYDAEEFPSSWDALYMITYATPYTTLNEGQWKTARGWYGRVREIEGRRDLNQQAPSTPFWRNFQGIDRTPEWSDIAAIRYSTFRLAARPLDPVYFSEWDLDELILTEANAGEVAGYEAELGAAGGSIVSNANYPGVVGSVQNAIPYCDSGQNQIARDKVILKPSVAFGRAQGRHCIALCEDMGVTNVVTNTKRDRLFGVAGVLNNRGVNGGWAKNREDVGEQFPEAMLGPHEAYDRTDLDAGQQAFDDILIANGITPWYESEAGQATDVYQLKVQRRQWQIA